MKSKALQQHIYRTIHLIITNASKQLNMIIYAYQLGLIATLALKPAHPNPNPPHTHTNRESVSLPATNVTLVLCS